MAEVGILIIDDDVVSQRALKNVLDSEGCRVRVAPLASEAMAELASRWDRRLDAIKGLAEAAHAEAKATAESSRK